MNLGLIASIASIATLILLVGALLRFLYRIAIREDQVQFQERWPAISDEEFLRRCTPGVRPEVALKVRQIIAKQLGIPYENIYPEQEFVRDLNCD